MAEPTPDTHDALDTEGQRIFSKPAAEAPAHAKPKRGFLWLLKWFGLSVIALFALLIGISIYVAATASPEQKAKWAKELAQREVERKRERAEEDRIETEKRGALAAAEKEKAKGDAIALFKKVTEIAAPCDAAAGSLAPAIQSGDVVSAYRAAELAESTCLSTGSEIGNIEIPSSFDENNSVAATKAIDSCNNAYVGKWAAAKKLKEILDGYSSVSARAELQDLAEQVKTGALLCSVGLVSLATENGASSQDLGIKNESGK